MQVETDSPQMTVALAADLARRLRPGDVVALDGQLGAGKTCFVRGLAGGLGIDPAAVSSPTFVLVHEYEPRERPGGGRSIPLIHIDAYRLSDAGELDSLGWEEMLDGDAVIVVEWAERVRRALPGDSVRVWIEHLGDLRRRIHIDEPAR